MKFFNILIALSFALPTYSQSTVFAPKGTVWHLYASPTEYEWFHQQGQNAVYVMDAIQYKEFYPPDPNQCIVKISLGVNFNHTETPYFNWLGVNVAVFQVGPPVYDF